MSIKAQVVYQLIVSKKAAKILKIDTSQIGRVVVVLEVGDGKWEMEKEQRFGSQVLLNMIEEVVKKGGVELKDLSGVEVQTGPGSFTGLRVGVSVANALGFSLKIPVNGKKLETEITY